MDVIWARRGRGDFGDGISRGRENLDDLACAAAFSDREMQWLGRVIDDAVRFARESPFPVPETLFDHTYAG